MYSKGIDIINGIVRKICTYGRIGPSYFFANFVSNVI